MPVPAPIDPTTSVLLTVDMVPAGITRVPAAADTVPYLRNALDAARDAGSLVAHVRVHLTAEEARAVSTNNKMFGHFATMTPPPDGAASMIDERLAARTDEPVYTKIRMGSFSTTGLHAALRADGRDTIVLAGTATSGAVLSTVREGADLDYRVVVLSDCCADFDPDVHSVLVEKVFPMTAEVMDSTAFAAALAP